MGMLLFIAILVSAFPPIVIARSLFDCLQQIRPKKTIKAMKRVFILSALAGPCFISLFSAFPKMLIAVVIVLMMISAYKFTQNTIWDKKSAKAIFLSGLPWSLYLIMELKMPTWSYTALIPVRIDLLFIAPVLFITAATVLCSAFVNMSESEKRGLVYRSCS